jgi:hypothetical protein
MSTQNANSVAITGGSVNGTTIGATTASTVTGTTVTATTLVVNDNSTLGSSNSDTVSFNARVNSDIDPSTDNTYDLGRNSHAWRNLYLTGTANIAALSASGTTTLSGLTASTALALNASKQVVSVTNTGTGDNVLSNSPTLVTPALGTPSSGTVTNLTGTASININGTVGATTASTGAFTTLTTSSTVTLNGGTANGVSFLNASKVLTTGSALTFDGALLAVGGTATEKITTNGAIRVTGFQTTAGTGTYLSQSTTALGELAHYGPDNSTMGQLRFYLATANGGIGGEQMRLTNTGLGIGTSSPAYKLDVNTVGGSAATARLNGNDQSNVRLRLENGGSGGRTWELVGGLPGANNSNFSIFDVTGSTTPLTIDAPGNLGLGGTPSAWDGYTALELPFSAAFVSATNQSQSVLNTFYNGTNWLYKNSNFASRYVQSSGQHLWLTAPSGTAGASVSWTQAMTLTADGDLAVGATSTDGSRLYVSDAAGDVAFFTNTVNADLSIKCASSVTTISPSTGTLAFGTNSTERARIDSSGNLLVGTTSGSERLRVSATNNAAGFLNTTAASATAFSWNQATSGDNIFYEFGTEASFTSRGSITYNRTAGLTAYNTTSDYRAKDISGPVTDSGALIDSVPVYMGKMKGATQERPMFIAHEVPAYAHTGEKDAVDDDGNPVYQQMDASALIPVMWAEIQSLRARLAALESI